MTRSTIAVLLAASASLALAACDGAVHFESDGGGDYKTLARLDCPEREDQLRRVSASADGRTCTYEGEGAEVRLQLVTLNGRTPGEVLAPYERELRALMPDLTPAADRPALADLDTDTGTVVGVESTDEKAHVRMPGLSIDAEGDRAQVRIGGALTIDADDRNSVVKIRSEEGVGGLTVDADETGAEIRSTSDEGGDLRSTFILASDAPSPTGLRMVGYEARGPEAGPVIVATIRARNEDNDKPMDAMKDLVRKNIG